MAASIETGLENLALNVKYCEHCTLPPEYCEFTECAKRLAEQSGANNAASGGAASSSSTSNNNKNNNNNATNANNATTSDDHKRQTRGGKAQGPKAKKPAEKRLQVFRSNRGKKKFVTVVVGMATFGVDLKEASKLFSKKFACSSSVTGTDEIVVQGDVKNELIELIPERFPEIDADLIEDGGDQKR